MDQILLHAGADLNATSNSYGGTPTVLELLTTSAHPYDAGKGVELEELLEAK